MNDAPPRSDRLTDIGTILRTSPVIPVLVIEDVAYALPIAEALVKGGLPVFEVTLRTPCALDALKVMQSVPGAVVGAGTVITADDLYAAADAGADFVVSPGLTKKLGKVANGVGIPFLPGAAIAADLMLGLDLGFSHFRFFPAVPSGGIPALKALAGSFAAARFCPAGGITHATAGNWLALDAVLCVGGTWVVPAGPPNPAAIEAAARDARTLAR